MSSIPQTYTISDFIEWNNKKQLFLSPDFQRGSVWTLAAKVFLIDSILNDYPIPQVYLRTKIDPTTQITIREVVDGQQRLRAVLEFASGKLKLTSKAPNYKGKTYNDLDTDEKERFLSYKIPVVQLLNAKDSDVLEVFARLNSYSVKVTPAELRHAEYSDPIKWAIYDFTKEWSILWSEYKLVGTRDCVRLKNNSFIAELFMIFSQGLSTGGEAQITTYYKNNKEKDEEYFRKISLKISSLLSLIIDKTASELKDTIFYDAPSFLILFTSVAILEGFDSPASKITEDIEEYRGRGVDWEKASERMILLVQAFEEEENREDKYSSFISNTKSTTHSAASRKARLSFLVREIMQDAAL